MTIRPLRTNFTRSGFVHAMISRVDDIAIFARSKDGIEHFEVIRVRTSRPHPNDPNPDGADLVETYPSDEKWGLWAFTCKTRQEADAKAAHMAIAQSR
jgi:hypothetical protein